MEAKERGADTDDLWAEELAKQQANLKALEERETELRVGQRLDISRLTRVVARLIGNREPGATRLERVLIRDRAAAREQVARMLAWDFDRIALAHGDIVETGGHEVLRRAYAWL